MSTGNSHLVHVEALPEDCLRITEYGKHSFTNLFYSPSTKNLYQQYAKRIRVIETVSSEPGTKKNIYVRSSEGKTLYISNKKLNKIISDLLKPKSE